MLNENNISLQFICDCSLKSIICEKANRLMTTLRSKPLKKGGAYNIHVSAFGSKFSQFSCSFGCAADEHTTKNRIVQKGVILISSLFVIISMGNVQIPFKPAPPMLCSHQLCWWVWVGGHCYSMYINLKKRRSCDTGQTVSA